MGIEKINPDGLAPPAGYSHVAVATGTKRVYLAGQVGTGPDGTVAGPDLASQTAQAFRNVETALAAAGAGWDDVAKMTVYIVQFDDEQAGHFFAGIGEVFGDAMPVTATTLIGVHSLYQPELLVEIEVIAEI